MFDIFIYDYISHKNIIIKLKVLLLKLMDGLSRNEFTIKNIQHSYMTTHHTWLQRTAMIILYQVGKLINPAVKRRLLRKTQMTFPGDKRHVHRSNDQFRGLPIVLMQDLIKKTTRTLFAGYQLPVHENYDYVLRSTYGNDYMIPPPVKLRDKHTDEENISICETFNSIYKNIVRRQVIAKIHCLQARKK
jgi:phosphorylcholine metabolism protein LicD